MVTRPALSSALSCPGPGGTPPVPPTKKCGRGGGGVPDQDEIGGSPTLQWADRARYEGLLTGDPGKKRACVHEHPGQPGKGGVPPHLKNADGGRVSAGRGRPLSILSVPEYHIPRATARVNTTVPPFQRAPSRPTPVYGHYAHLSRTPVNKSGSRRQTCIT